MPYQALLLQYDNHKKPEHGLSLPLLALSGHL
jgi:hypothetical protein